MSGPGTSKPNANNDICPISLTELGNIQNPFKPCLDKATYEADALAEYVFKHKKCIFPTTRVVIPVEDIFRLFKQLKGKYKKANLQQAFNDSIAKQQELAKRYLQRTKDPVPSSINDLAPTVQDAVKIILDIFKNYTNIYDLYYDEELGELNTTDEKVKLKKYMVIGVLEQYDTILIRVIIETGSKYYHACLIYDDENIDEHTDGKIVKHYGQTIEYNKTANTDVFDFIKDQVRSLDSADEEGYTSTLMKINVTQLTSDQLNGLWIPFSSSSRGGSKKQKSLKPKQAPKSKQTPNQKQAPKSKQTSKQKPKKQ